jgi:hypothetical protein
MNGTAIGGNCSTDISRDREWMGTLTVGDRR